MAAALLLSSCGCELHNWCRNGFKVGPEYSPAPAAVSSDWIENQDPRVEHTPLAHPDWWSVFQDPLLNNLIQTAYQQNLSLREAGWRVMQARNQRAIAVGSIFPQQQQAFGDYNRILESQNTALPSPLRAFDDWAAGAGLAWELDVWGRYRRAIASADANVQVAVGDYDAMLISLIAEVASAYTEYRTFQQRLEYARHNVEIQEGSLKLTEAKANEGATGFTGVHLARSNLESTRAIIPDLEVGLRQASNRLCTLLGMPTDDLTGMLGVGGIPAAPEEVAIGIPVDLIRRRPDVRAAERAVAAQSEQIGIAASELYPHFSIAGQFAYHAENLSDLFSSGSSSGSIGPSFQWNILNYGRLINNVRLQESGLQELIAGYQNTVLTANQEVEDALVAFLRTQERVQFLQTSVAETEESLRLLTISFNEGDIDFTGVFLLQGELVGLQDRLAQTRGQVVTSLIQLYKALGGGWEVRFQGFAAPAAIIPGGPPTREPVPSRPAGSEGSPPILPEPPAVMSLPDAASSPVSFGLASAWRAVAEHVETQESASRGPNHPEVVPAVREVESDQ